MLFCTKLGKSLSQQSLVEQNTKIVAAADWFFDRPIQVSEHQSTAVFGDISPRPVLPSWYFFNYQDFQ
jgi:hypothetical protein